MTPAAETPEVPPGQLPDEYFADWNPLTVNEYLRRQPLADQVSLALAAVEWTREKADAQDAVSDFLAGDKDDLTQALQLLA